MDVWALILKGLNYPPFSLKFLDFSIFFLILKHFRMTYVSTCSQMIVMAFFH